MTRISFKMVACYSSQTLALLGTRGLHHRPQHCVWLWSDRERLQHQKDRPQSAIAHQRRKSSQWRTRFGSKDFRHWISRARSCQCALLVGAILAQAQSALEAAPANVQEASPATNNTRVARRHDGSRSIKYINTKKRSADILTRGFTNSESWMAVLSFVAMFGMHH